MGLEDINKAFDLMHEGKSIRTVIHFKSSGKHQAASCMRRVRFLVA